MPTPNLAQPAADGLSVVWSRMNLAWFVMWGDHGHVLRVCNTRAEADAYVADLRRTEPQR